MLLKSNHLINVSTNNTPNTDITSYITNTVYLTTTIYNSLYISIPLSTPLYLPISLYTDCYQVDDDDHCETPENAYSDINKTLEYMLLHTHSTADTEAQAQSEVQSIVTYKANCTIYDPFYCQGSVVKRLGEQGYANIYNKVR